MSSLFLCIRTATRVYCTIHMYYVFRPYILPRAMKGTTVVLQLESYCISMSLEETRKVGGSSFALLRFTFYFFWRKQETKKIKNKNLWVGRELVLENAVGVARVWQDINMMPRIGCSIVLLCTTTIHTPNGHRSYHTHTDVVNKQQDGKRRIWPSCSKRYNYYVW